MRINKKKNKTSKHRTPERQNYIQICVERYAVGVDFQTLKNNSPMQLEEGLIDKLYVNMCSVHYSPG